MEDKGRESDEIRRLRSRASVLGEELLDREQIVVGQSQQLERTLEELRSLNQALEQRVRERTAELERALQALAERERQFRTTFELAAVGQMQIEQQDRREEKFRQALESAPCAMIMVSPETGIVLVNKMTETLFGYSRAELLGQPVEVLVPERLRAGHRDYRADFVAAPLARPMGAGREVYGRRKDGSEFQVEVGLNPIETEEGLFVLAAVADITARKRAEEALRESEERLRWALEVSSDGLWDWNVATGEVYFSRRWLETLGYAREEMPPHFTSWQRLIHPDDLPRVMELLNDHFEGKTAIFECENRLRTKSGHYRWNLERGGVVTRDASGKPLRMIGVDADITERKQGEEQLRASVREKEVLLQEIQHRVKNNLQVVGSLLSLRSSTVKDPALLEVLRESHNRVRSIALVHDHLYRAGRLAQVNLAQHVERLCAHLFRSYGADPARVHLEVQVEPAALELDQAIPCSLVINELVSNALKHAFPDGRSGRVLVTLSAQADQAYSVVVSDDGVGLPPNVDVKSPASLGLQIVCDLTKQIGGSLTARRNGGTTFALHLPIRQS